jgi:1,2-diacylglycerol 3-beta-galactosyltransferase
MYVASERIRKLAKRRGKTPDDRLVMSGLPIRHDFAIQAENLGDRTSKEGKAYQKSVREELGLDPNKQMVLVMGGGEGVGSLSTIVDDLYARFSTLGINATIAVVCGRNEKLRSDLETRDWEAVLANMGKRKKRERVYRMFKKLRSRRIQRALDRFEERRSLAANGDVQRGHVDVVGLGFVTRMAEYMVAADILVSKAGPGSIAEAAAVGLPVMLTRYVCCSFFAFVSPPLFSNDLTHCLFFVIVGDFLVFCLVKRLEM